LISSGLVHIQKNQNTHIKTNKDHMSDNIKLGAVNDDSHALGKQYLDAANLELQKGNIDKVLAHLATAQELLHPGSHRRPEIREIIEALTIHPEKIEASISSHEPIYSIDQAIAALEQTMNQYCPGVTNVLRKVHEDGNFWEIDAFFVGTKDMQFVTISHARPDAVYPLLYTITDYYQREVWLRSSFDGCVRKVLHLLTF